MKSVFMESYFKKADFKKFMLKLGMMFLLGFFGVMLTGSVATAGQKTHTVFFQGEKNELNVYRIFGSKPGKTLLIIGGIQGDEPGGFLAADFYADFSLEKGNLIVVPRANFPSILKKERQINQDMNRKFMDDTTLNYEAYYVVTTLGGNEVGRIYIDIKS